MWKQMVDGSGARPPAWLDRGRRYCLASETHFWHSEINIKKVLEAELYRSLDKSDDTGVFLFCYCRRGAAALSFIELLHVKVSFVHAILLHICTCIFPEILLSLQVGNWKCRFSLNNDPCWHSETTDAGNVPECFVGISWTCEKVSRQLLYIVGIFQGVSYTIMTRSGVALITKQQELQEHSHFSLWSFVLSPLHVTNHRLCLRQQAWNAHSQHAVDPEMMFSCYFWSCSLTLLCYFCFILSSLFRCLSFSECGQFIF